MNPEIPPQSIWRRSAPLSSVPAWSDAFPLTPIMAHLEAAARTDSQAPALLGTRERLSVGEVLHRARRIGAQVRRAVPPGRAVATLLSHTPSGLAAILGCVAAGRITIPLNPADPPERLALLLGDAGAAALLTDATPPRDLPAHMRVLHVPDRDDAATQPGAEAHDPDAPAVVLYTSGSSGRPKGIVLSAYSVLFRAFQNIDGMRIERGSRVFTGYGPESGAGFAMIVSCLVHGAALLVASLPTDGVGATLRLCAAEQASLLTVPTPMLGTLLAPENAPAALAGVGSVRLGAAPLPHADYVRWRARLPRSCEISHSFGSTEAQRMAEWVLPDDYAGAGPVAPVGRMRPGYEYAIVSENQTPVPDGEIGELMLRGRHIAVGEWQNGGLVAGRMQPDPAQPGTRVFRTGDLVRLAADGMLHFAGRADRQININGMRVEPAEIEAVMRADAAVRDAAVVMSGPGGLHAFVAAPDADAEALRQALVARMREALPPPLRPRRVFVLASLPRLPGGKVDIVTLRRWAEQPEDRSGRS